MFIRLFQKLWLVFFKLVFFYSLCFRNMMHCATINKVDISHALTIGNQEGRDANAPPLDVNIQINNPCAEKEQLTCCVNIYKAHSQLVCSPDTSLKAIYRSTAMLTSLLTYSSVGKLILGSVFRSPLL